MEQKFCQSCGMPLTTEVLGTHADGSKSEDYCIYCYKDGAFTGNFTMEEMAEYCSMFVEEYNKNTGKTLTACEYKQVLMEYYPTLKRWKGDDATLPHADHPIKKVLIEEINALGIHNLHITNLYVLQGAFVNQAYHINGNEVKLLNDNDTYWGTQVVKDDGKCFGIACDEKYILVGEYGPDGSNPEIIVFKKR